MSVDGGDPATVDLQAHDGMRDRLGQFGDSEVVAIAAPHYVAAYQRTLKRVLERLDRLTFSILAV